MYEDNDGGRGAANGRQVGGDHYKTGGEEHWDRVARLGLDYFQGQVTKYVERWRKKGGLQDLHKARHFLDKYIELETGKVGVPAANQPPPAVPGQRDPDPLTCAWREVAAYVALNARNPRKGYRLGEITPEDVLARAQDELDELRDAPDDADELVDLLGCLFHYAQRRGWTPERLAEGMARKLALRFPEAAAARERAADDGVRAAGDEGARVQTGAGYSEPPYDHDQESGPVD